MASLYNTDEAASRIKRMIVADVRAGHIPNDVADFAALHDHVDANMYLVYAGFISPVVDADACGLTKDQADDLGNEISDATNETMDLVSEWIRAGNLRRLGPRL